MSIGPHRSAISE
ncbi:hypothetical protein D018_4071A, partial [Vibrio parahaemolyticus VP2007-007]